MKFSKKKTCNGCRGGLAYQGCLFGVKVLIESDGVNAPVEPCMKPITHEDMKALCASGDLEAKLDSWRKGNG